MCVCLQMDPSWAKYNMARVRFGLDAWVDPEDFSTVIQEQDKGVLARIGTCMVKLTGFAADGSPASYGSGFLYTQDDNLIVTCDHVRHFSQPQQPHEQHDVSVFKAMYPDGMEEEVQVLTPPQAVIDIMLLRGSRRAPRNMLAALPTTGDTAYVAGFPPESTSVCYSKGIIGSTSHADITVDAHADNGWSGGPVVNNFGRLVGVIKRGAGATIKRPLAISPTLLHAFLLENHAPGLCG